MATKEIRNAAIVWMGNFATTTPMKSTHNWRKKHADNKFPIPHACEIKDYAFDRPERIDNEDD